MNYHRKTVSDAPPRQKNPISVGPIRKDGRRLVVLVYNGRTFAKLYTQQQIEEIR